MYDISPRPTRPCRPAARALAALAILAALFGCAVPGALFYKVVGPPPVPARYTPAKDEPLVVMVEAGHAPSASVPEAEELLQALQEDLATNKVAPMVDLSRIHDLRDREGRSFTKLSISEIGRRVGAKHIIYVDLTHCDLLSDTGTDVYKLKLSARVRVVDAMTAQTLWPDAEAGEAFEYETKPTRATSDFNPSSIKREALKMTGSEIARMFYPWKPETMTEENRDQKLR